MANEILTSAEAAENSVLPMIYEVHTDPRKCAPEPQDLPAMLQQPAGAKSAAQWAYERLVLYIRNFESQLDNDQEVAMGFTGSDAGVIRIEGMGYFDPDILTFYGTDEAGTKTQLVQHVSQLNVMLSAMPVQPDQQEPNRIGFHLAHDLNQKAK